MKLFKWLNTWETYNDSIIGLFSIPRYMAITLRFIIPLALILSFIIVIYEALFL